MNNNSKSRNRFIHLYDPKKEGLGLYDINYINAYKKNKNKNFILSNNNTKRCAAWFHSLEAFQN